MSLNVVRGADLIASWQSIRTPKLYFSSWTKFDLKLAMPATLTDVGGWNTLFETHLPVDRRESNDFHLAPRSASWETFSP